MGAANQEFLASSWEKASKGLSPREYSIKAGTVLYRFIDTSHMSPQVAADGPWWFEFEHYKSIQHFAERNDYSLGYSARLFAAICYEWSEVNAVVRAEVMVPLGAWKGRGKQVIVGKDRALHKPELDPRDVNRTRAGLITERSPISLSKMTPMQGPNEVYQIYIPGLGRPNHGFSRYLKYLGHAQITTG